MTPLAEPASQPDRRILVVDDDPDWRHFVRASLEQLGYDVSEASDGAEALRRLRSEPYSVVLLDLAMPGIGGEDVSLAMGDGGPKVVFVTGANMSDLAPAMQTGARYYLPKNASPAQFELLLHSLSEH